MTVKHEFKDQNLSGALFRGVDLSGAVFESIDLSGTRFFDINWRDSEIGAIDFGGSSFSCMNTGECFPRKPARFKNLELDDCTMESCYFRNTAIVNCDLTGMTIDGIPVTDLLAAYKKISRR